MVLDHLLIVTHRLAVPDMESTAVLNRLYFSVVSKRIENNGENLSDGQKKKLLASTLTRKVDSVLSTDMEFSSSDRSETCLSLDARLRLIYKLLVLEENYMPVYSMAMKMKTADAIIYHSQIFLFAFF
ncbi:MAG: hypothetical protein ACI4WR_10420 [Bulleidia sp.]